METVTKLVPVPQKVELQPELQRMCSHPVAEKFDRTLDIMASREAWIQAYCTCVSRHNRTVQAITGITRSLPQVCLKPDK
ncbi:hypothetical protein P6F34_gp03 [Pseudomonas phage MiCath]|uniref:Uncharacterized protein n=1 Tax=Pseudomonas phage MiCath TaxID=3003729 RepID=A0AAE9VE80_9CAUD|nr:hypothetical protein P6F34_gp03 [Pseudomonas phage MiCath]WAX22357.1 hypothetical protein [Pseudomonas phage MiCath]